MFSGRLSVRAYMRPGALPVSTIPYKPVDGILQNFVHDVVEVTNELFGFSRSRVQGQGSYKVKCAKIWDPLSPE